MLSDLRTLAYDGFAPVSVGGAGLMAVPSSVPRLHFPLSLDPLQNDALERAYSVVSVLAKAFQGFDNALRLVLDNAAILGDHPLVKALAVATKLALCHAKAAAAAEAASPPSLRQQQQQQWQQQQQQQWQQQQLVPNAPGSATQQTRALAETALWRAAQLQDVLLGFSAEHIVAQTERIIAGAPPKLTGVTSLRIALEVNTTR